MSEHVIVVDLGYGDAGKGTVVDWLCAQGPVQAVVRFNGGGQAGHNVVLPDGRHHTFAQFGSGTLRGVPTHLSRFMVVDPLALASEAAHLAGLGVPDPFGLLTVDRDALLATPYHVAAGRARELARGADRHGSCGMGVGETMAYALGHPGLGPTVGDCEDPALLTRKLRALREALGVTGPAVEDCVAAYRAFAERVALVDSSYTAALLRGRPVVFEGAQGVLLDEWHGFHPHTTWSTTTFANALALLDGVPAVRLGVLRTYTTRHGPGPLVTEDPELEAAEAHNADGPWQGPFRVGHFDAVAHRYALAVAGGADALALTHLDAPVSRMCVSYDIGELPAGPPGDLDRQARLTGRVLRARPRYAGGIGAGDWPAAVADALGVPVCLGSAGPTVADKVRLSSVIAPERV
ncbi:MULTISPECIES: adenylosuccinate synthetase [Streptosporangium]|uniref:Adenylosuccinate synthetase n=1 Tax=Streptosporangium brasiliense TaxID=47480 RepID=A0ABT9R5U2_9ACTN|nr:adenylosuccinate synthetase [Streptosporangium brasiliense]MDP9864616.1 adenylosuccinate synthase [Streptosporangium brasiliense]